MSTNATNAQVAALLKTLNVAPTPGNITQFQTVLGNVSEGGCASEIEFGYKIEDSLVRPGNATLSGGTSIRGTYDITIAVEDLKGNLYKQATSFTDSFSFETGVVFDGVGVYIVNITISNQAEIDCGPYCSIQPSVPPSVRQDISALTTSCV